MNNGWDKIRILWIDDREELYGLPEPSLPQECQPFFRVVHPATNDAEIHSFASADEIAPVVEQFWRENDTSILPAEIIATDYNLSKYSASVRRPQSAPPRQKRYEEIVIESQQNNETEALGGKTVNFDGLLVGTFYAALTHAHPAAIVSITNYDSDMPSEVKTLQQLATPFLGVDFDFNLRASERSWDRIICEAMPHLRQRIEALYREGEIVVSHRDTMALVDSPSECEALTIISRFGTRRLPVQGLFCDIDSDKRADEITTYAKGLLETRVTREQFDRATELAKMVWAAYDDTDNGDRLLEKHCRYSSLHAKGETSSEEYKQLRALFGHRLNKDKNDECEQHCVDIRSGEKFNDSERRWASLLLIRLLLKRILICMRKVSAEAELDPDDYQFYIPLEKDDLLLLLFPRPSNHFPLPWHIGDPKERSNAKSTWENYLKRKLSINLKDTLKGDGLSVAERQVLQGIAIDEDIELGQDAGSRLEAWKSYEPAKRFLFGTDSVHSEDTNE